jgi:hypothetical protein
MFDQKIQQLERFIGQTDTQTIVTENAQHGIELERAESEDHRMVQLPRFRAYFHATRWLKPSYSHHTPNYFVLNFSCFPVRVGTGIINIIPQKPEKPVRGPSAH